MDLRVLINQPVEEIKKGITEQPRQKLFSLPLERNPKFIVELFTGLTVFHTTL